MKFFVWRAFRDIGDVPHLSLLFARVLAERSSRLSFGQERVAKRPRLSSGGGDIALGALPQATQACQQLLGLKQSDTNVKGGADVYAGKLRDRASWQKVGKPRGPNSIYHIYMGVFFICFLPILSKFGMLG